MIIYDLYCAVCDSEYKLYLEPSHDPLYCPACGNLVNHDEGDKQEEDNEHIEEYYDEMDPISDGEW